MHPDKCDHPRATEAFQLLATAFATLSDAEKHAAYSTKLMQEAAKAAQEAAIARARARAASAPAPPPASAPPPGSARVAAALSNRLQRLARVVELQAMAIKVGVSRSGSAAVHSP